MSASCFDGLGHRFMPGTLRENHRDESQTAECLKCHQPMRRFFVDDDDRRGRWSAWKALEFIIEELDP